MPYAQIPLLACLLLTSATAFSAASPAERDERANVIAQLISGRFRLPAQRAIDAFVKAGFESDGAYADALNFAYADTFGNIVTDKAEGARLADVCAKLKVKVETWAKGRQLPPELAALLSTEGTAKLLRLINDALGIIRPDYPIMVELTDGQIAAINNAVKGVIDIAMAEFKSGAQKVEANKGFEDKAMELGEGPEAMKLNQDAVMLRLQALEPMRLAHIFLREVVTSGEKRKINVTAANDFLHKFLLENQKKLEQWDFEFSDYHPKLKVCLNELICEGVRQKIDGYEAENAEAQAMQIVDWDLTPIKDPKVRDQVVELQLQVWAHLLRWQLELNTPTSIAHGIANFQDFQTRGKTDKNLSVTNTDPQKANAIGQVYIYAARLQAAKGNGSTAGGLLVEVQNAKGPQAAAAKMWMATLAGGMKADDWGQQPISEEPAQALAIGKAFMSQAAGAVGEQSRKFYMNAAVKLRAGVLGLNNSEFKGQFVECAPGLYMSYSSALYKLNWYHQAAIAAHEGLQSIERVASESKKNPWKDANGGWTSTGKQVSSLANNALIYVMFLNSRLKSPAIAKLYGDTIDLAQKIDESLVGKGTEWNVVVGLDGEGKFGEAIDAATAYQNKYPEDWYKVFNFITSVRLRWITQIKEKDPKKAAEVLDQLNKNLAAAADRIKKDRAAPNLPKERLKELDEADNVIVSARIGGLVQEKKYTEVFAQLGPKFWANPPADVELGGRMLSLLSQAMYDNNRAATADPKTKADPKRLLETWPAYKDIARIFKKQAPKYASDANDGVLSRAKSRLASVYYSVSNLAAVFANAKQNANEMEAIHDEALRYFADFMVIKDDTAPATIFVVAKTLWDLGEKDRAAKDFELYKKSLDVDPVLKAYRQNPEETIKAYGEELTTRQDFKAPWEERGGIRDLLIDKQGFMEEYANALDTSKLSEEKRDYAKASVKLDGFAKLVETQKGFLGADNYKKMADKLKELQQVAKGMNNAIKVDSYLAQYYRESGQADKAIPIFENLYKNYDPLNPNYAAGYVEGVLDAVRHNKPVDAKVIKNARDVSVSMISVVQGNAQQLDAYWTVLIQYLELSAAMDDKKVIAEKLLFQEKNKSTPRDDLMAPPVEGDDKRARRPRNALAVELSERFLDLYQFAPGMKPTFRIDTIDVRGKPMKIFADTDAPQFEIKTENRDGDDVDIIVPATNAPAADAQGK